MTNTKKLSSVRVAVLVMSCLLAAPVALRCQMIGAQKLDETGRAARCVVFSRFGCPPSGPHSGQFSLHRGGTN